MTEKGKIAESSFKITSSVGSFIGSRGGMERQENVKMTRFFTAYPRENSQRGKSKRKNHRAKDHFVSITTLCPP
jgi:hypothetical protein